MEILDLYILSVSAIKLQIRARNRHSYLSTPKLVTFRYNQTELIRKCVCVLINAISKTAPLSFAFPTLFYDNSKYFVA